jgi:peptidoglycan/xylan/chitin deacetylase (PgdA/CDA1 family)
MTLWHLERWAEVLLSESYRSADEGTPGWLLSAFYRARPFLPRSLQLWLRRRYARRRESRGFLSWPIDGLFVAFAEAYLAIRLELDGRDAGPVAARWPSGFRAAAVLTHDVEGLSGQARCRDLMALEREKGYRSCFNFVADRYQLDHGLMDEMRTAGFEIGSHGIKHDGLKFSSRAVFEDRVRLLREVRERWQSIGFRSPATHRRWEWMPELPFEYDSSYPDTDPYEPIPGGCGSPWPFRLGPLVELPVTMPQDHTLWEILQRPALPVWRQKAEWLRACGGLINIIVHPDYLTTPERWQEYAAFLNDLRSTPDVWVGLPRDIATWWRARGRDREQVSLVNVDHVHRLEFSMV